MTSLFKRITVNLPKSNEILYISKKKDYFHYFANSQVMLILRWKQFDIPTRPDHQHKTL